MSVTSAISEACDARVSKSERGSEGIYDSTEREEGKSSGGRLGETLGLANSAWRPKDYEAS